jgi:Thr operon leader peptide
MLQGIRSLAAFLQRELFRVHNYRAHNIMKRISITITTTITITTGNGAG